MIEKKRQGKTIVISILCLVVVLLIIVFYVKHTADTTKTLATEIKYGDNKNQNFTLYTPHNNEGGKSPIVLYIHGGGWEAGDKSNVSEKPKYFTDKGYTFVSMNYRLVPDANNSEMADDVTTVIKWLDKHATKYNINMKKLTLMGHSAGGQLALLVAMDERYLKKANLPKNSVHAVINIEGPVDLMNFVKEIPSYGKILGTNQKELQKNSPITYSKKSNLPPLLFIAHQDYWNDSFMNNYRYAGNDVMYYQAINTSHSNLTKYLGTQKSDEAIAMTKMLTKFLQKNE